MPKNRGYYDTFVSTCAKNPSDTAVYHYNDGVFQSYSYSELYGVCEYISQILIQLQCVTEVGIISQRNPLVPSALAAVHRCAPTFIFLDPLKDNSYTLSMIDLCCIISISEEGHPLKHQPKQPNKSVNIFGYEINFYKLDSKSQTPILGDIDSNLHSFIAMSSGSTGKLKFIKVPIECLQPNITDLKTMFKINKQDVIYFSTPLTFDPSMIEILLAIENSASLLIAPEDPKILFSSDETSITFWQTTPSRFMQLSDSDMSGIVLAANSPLRVLAFGGEPLTNIQRLRTLKAEENKTKIYSLYGVTELSCWACIAEVDLDKIKDDEVPLGECLSETSINLSMQRENSMMGTIMLDSKTRHCSLLTRRNMYSYLGKSSIDTGDLGESKYGTIYYRGRSDDVIKRFGNRINLMFVEATALKMQGIRACSCLWLATPHVLVMYYTSDSVTTKELTAYLKKNLDEMFLPDKVIRLDTIPLTDHGKASKYKLREIYLEDSSEPKPLESLFMETLNASLNSNFKYKDIKNKDFFSIGGTSFLAVAMCNQIKRVYPEYSSAILPYLASSKMPLCKIFDRVKKLPELKKTLPVRKKRHSADKYLNIKKPKVLELPKENQKSEPSKDVFNVVWSYNTGKCVDASPTVFETPTQVFITVGSHSGTLVVLEALKGTAIGTLHLKSRIEASVLCVPGPEACGVVGTHDGTLIRFQLDGCQVVWRVQLGTMVKSRPELVKDKLYIAAYDGAVRYLDYATGDVLGTISIGSHGISADLTVDGESLIVATLAGVCACITTAGNTEAAAGNTEAAAGNTVAAAGDTAASGNTVATPSNSAAALNTVASSNTVAAGHTVAASNTGNTGNTVAWRCTLNSPVFARPALLGSGRVVFAEVGGAVHCYDVATGAMIWTYNALSGNVFSSMHVMAVEYSYEIVLGCHDMCVYCLTSTEQGCSLKWRTELSAPIYSTPCALDSELLVAVANDGKINLLDKCSGTVTAQYSLPDECFSSPSVYGDLVFLGCRNDCIYGLRYIKNSNVM